MRLSSKCQQRGDSTSQALDVLQDAADNLALAASAACVGPIVFAAPLPRFPYIHMRLVLKMRPLHRRSLPLRVWRLVMSLLEAESSFCNLIIPYFTGVIVFLCVKSSCAIHVDLNDFARNYQKHIACSHAAFPSRLVLFGKALLL